MNDTISFRQGTLEDIPNALPLIEEFVQESIQDYGLSIDPQIALNQFREYVDCSMVAYEGDKMVGLIAGKISDFDVSDQSIFKEQVWFVSKEYRHGVGRLLLEAMEEYLREDGVSFCVMAHMANSRAKALERFYIKQGYRPMEIHYIKKL